MLSITPAHGGIFTQGQQNATYQLTVSNPAGAGSTGGTVTVTDTMPAGLILVSMSGAGWTCTVLPSVHQRHAARGRSQLPCDNSDSERGSRMRFRRRYIFASVSGGGSLTASTNDAIPSHFSSVRPPLPTGAHTIFRKQLPTRRLPLLLRTHAVIRTWEWLTFW